MKPGDSIGSYRIERLLGVGGMGSVYAAQNESIERRVAVKVLHAEYARDRDAVSRFFDEARATNRIEHPSIVQISEFSLTSDGIAYLVMEFLRGESLARQMERVHAEGRRLELVQILQIAWQVADALAVAHLRGIVHRDLKPDNLMLVPDPVAPSGERVKILDFGIAKLTDGQAPSRAKTDVKAIIGTPLYMAPEQCAGAGGVDAKADVYALGVVLFEMLAGRPPFLAEGGGQIMGMHMFQAPPQLAELVPSAPEALRKLVHRLLLKDKGPRPEMREVRDELLRLLVELESPSSTRFKSWQPVTAPETAGPRGLLAERPQNTTLGHSLGQTLRQIAASRLKLAAAAVLGGLLVGLSGLLLRFSYTDRHDGASRPQADLVAPPQTSSATPSQPMGELPLVPKAQPAAKHVRWSITTNPIGAEVVDETSTSLGRTPWTRDQETMSGSLTLRLRKVGYQEQTVHLRRDQDETLQKTLVALPRRTPVKVQPTTSKKPAPGQAGGFLEP